MSTARDALEAATARFRELGRADLVGDLRRFLAHFLSVGLTRLDASLDNDLPDDTATQFHDGAQALLDGVPVSKLIGRRAFWNDEFYISLDVLDPRPDTETLVEAALQVPFKRVLDLGTGSGCILVSLLNERRDATGVGTDISEEAIAVARRNVKEAGCRPVAKILRSDWYERVEGKFDLIVSNPPYIDAATYETLAPNVRIYDPKIALTPGPTGLEAYEVIIGQAADFLTAGGHLMVEIGFDQATSVSALFEQAGFTNIRVLPDINGKDRVIAANLR